mmetsp:Transcript_29537/g.41182  ORF Transcript_29537/g.41182 Transcript_29537/m.41182 type:complete len:106 (-) Transcript_29537:106-423(-)
MSMEEAVAAIERAAYQNGVTDVLQSLARQEFQQQLKDSAGKKNSEKRSMLGTVLENMQSMFGAAHQAQPAFQQSRITGKSRSSEYDKKAASTKDHVHGDENNGGI